MADQSNWASASAQAAGTPFELRYDLTRRQRLVPHLRCWGPITLLAPLLVVGLLAQAFRANFWWALGLVPAYLLFRGFFTGLLDAAIHPVWRVHLRVEEKALGIKSAHETDDARGWIFLDGITAIDQLMAGVWTIRFWGGQVVNIPASAITETQLAHLRAGLARSRDPAHVAEVLERGRKLIELERQERHARRGDPR